VIVAAFVIGLVAFGLLLFPLTDPSLYGSVLWLDSMA